MNKPVNEMCKTEIFRTSTGKMLLKELNIKSRYPSPAKGKRLSLQTVMW